MDNLARNSVPASPQLEYGKVVSFDGEYMISTSYGDLKADCAVSCLVKPEAGDSVLVSVDADGEVWVLSVLSRASQSPTSIEVVGDTTLSVKGGSLTLSTDEELNCISKKSSVYSQEIDVSAENVSLNAGFFSSNIARVKRVADVVDDISREFTRRVKNYFRFTSESEDCQAESRRQLVDETLTMQSKNTVIVSEEHVKIDGELIHMG